MIESKFHRRPFLAACERIATDPYRYAAGGLGVDSQVVEIDVFTMKRGAGLFPNFSHGGDVFADHRIAIGSGKEGDADGFVFDFVGNIPYTDAKDESTASERLQRS